MKHELPLCGLFFCASCVLLGQQAAGADVLKLRSAASACAFASNLKLKNGTITVSSAQPAIAIAVRQIARTIKPLNPLKVDVYQADVEASLAVSTSDGHQAILYKNAFFAAMRKGTQGDAAIYSVLAHEISHIVNGDTNHEERSCNIASEREADRLSGFIMALLENEQFTDKDAVAAMAWADSPGDKCHPDKLVRQQAIREGFVEGRDEVIRRRPPQITEFAVDPVKIFEGQAVTLKWSTSRSQKTNIDPLGSVDAVGAKSLTPKTGVNVYTLTAINDFGTEHRDVRLEVLPVPQTPSWSCEAPSVHVRAWCDKGGLGGFTGGDEDRNGWQANETGPSTFCAHDEPNSGQSTTKSSCSNRQPGELSIIIENRLSGKGGYSDHKGCADKDHCHTQLSYDVRTGGASLFVEGNAAGAFVLIVGSTNCTSSNEGNRTAVRMSYNGKQLDVQAGAQYALSAVGVVKINLQGSASADSDWPGHSVSAQGRCEAIFLLRRAW